MSKICPIDASSVPLYPPRVTPPPKPLNLPKSFIKFLRNPLLTIPESVYHEPLVVLRGPPAIVWVTDPTLVKIVLVDHCDDFPQDRSCGACWAGKFGLCLTCRFHRPICTISFGREFVATRTEHQAIEFTGRGKAR